ncbi:TrmH family RNA methyltransferase [Haematomicrobium sanguinis]|uniref:TrmH family RNA methyltransferase n=1 Tax=Haematomicrobium sanguinis TaxID=479106 RepID=UPI00047DDEE0|nr:TrmH family RNA methyltransferase [Haematomicrobium sanguinis]
MNATRITRPNARFQQWEALLKNRTKRQRNREFLVQGVRPISQAMEHGWTIRALIFDADRSLSHWAKKVLAGADALGEPAKGEPAKGEPVETVAMSADLIRQLGEKDAEAPELVAVVELPEDDFDRIGVSPDFLGVVIDRPTMPGNVGSIIRSMDAFGGAGVIITGHAADPYDPKAVRASTGSLFALPVVRTGSHREVLDWVAAHRERGVAIQVVGTDEGGEFDIAEVNLSGPTLLVVGNETSGLSAGWRDAVDVMARIPIGGSASSLNAANAASVAMYEAARQRRVTPD